MTGMVLDSLYCYGKVISDRPEHDLGPYTRVWGSWDLELGLYRILSFLEGLGLRLQAFFGVGV